MEDNQEVYIGHKTDVIDQSLAKFIKKNPKDMKIMFIRESEGVYKFGQKRIYVKIEKGDKILVRIGGGYMNIEKFIEKYAPEEVAKLRNKNGSSRRVSNKV